jgi:DNA-binding PadR family transcriptional regulator
MSVRHGILGILAQGPQHGYELKQSFEDASGGFWNVNYGQIYTTLDRLVADDLVDMTVEPGGEGRGHERKVYHITPKGLSEFREWLEEPVGKIRPLRDEVFVKLALLGSEDPEPALRLLREQRQLYLVHMAQLTQKKQALSRHTSDDAFMADLLIDAALFHAEADLRWLEHCEAKIRTRHGAAGATEG